MKKKMNGYLFPITIRLVTGEMDKIKTDTSWMVVSLMFCNFQQFSMVLNLVVEILPQCCSDKTFERMITVRYNLKNTFKESKPVLIS